MLPQSTKHLLQFGWDLFTTPKRVLEPDVSLVCEISLNTHQVRVL